MPFVEKINGEYLIVSHRDVYRPKRKLKGGPRINYMVRYTEQSYVDSKGDIRKYPYPVIHFGRTQVMCPEELAGKRVKLVVQILDLPKRKGK